MKDQTIIWPFKYDQDCNIHFQEIYNTNMFKMFVINIIVSLLRCYWSELVAVKTVSLMQTSSLQIRSNGVE